MGRRRIGSRISAGGISQTPSDRSAHSECPHHWKCSGSTDMKWKNKQYEYKNSYTHRVSFFKT